MSGHYFISYSSVDAQEFAINLADALEAGPPSISVWLDKRKLRPGEDWDKQIVDAIRACEGVLFILSKDSVEDQSVCKQELIRALDYRKPVIPIKFHPDAEMPFRLGARQYIDFTGKFEPALASLRKHIRWLSSPEGKLQILRDRLADAQRALRRANASQKLKIESEISELTQQVSNQQQIVSGSRDASTAEDAKALNITEQNAKLQKEPLPPNNQVGVVVNYDTPIKGRGESHPKVALITAIICVLFVVFVFVYDDIKSVPFVQGVTGIIVTLAIAVILFSAISGSKATIKLPVSLAGAAAFYLILLPQIKTFIIPLHSFTGYVAYKSSSRSEKGYDPVEGAEVLVKGTGLNAKTDATGKFTISDVPSQVNISELVISRGGKIYQINIKEYPDKIYRIPREPEIIKSVSHTIGSNEWSEGKDTECPPVDKNKYSAIKHFSLHKTVPSEDGFSDLILRIWCQQGAEIISARKLEPQDGYKVQGDEDYSQAQKWSLPINGSEKTIRLSVCLGAASGGNPLSQSSLQAVYWFEKVE